jgi:hydrogenase nickel incorporation protein HypB
MCKECGCGLPGATAHEHHHDHGHSHEHHDEGQHADHEPPPMTIAVQRSLLEKNDRLAERNRGFFQAKGLLVLNVLSSPGSGKTTLIRETALALRNRLRVGVIVGDLATDNDAARLRAADIPVVQITTGTVCHLEADMVARAAAELNLDALDILVIENVGNLVCPSDYDLGERLRVVLLSTTEGEDKPLKYPPMFHSAHVAIITKTDMAAPAGFNREAALANLSRVSHHARVFEVSARTGQGMQTWVDYLDDQRQQIHEPPPHHHD